MPRIFKTIRPGFRYDRSLSVITRAHEQGLVTKSNLILGMGETTEEVVEALRELHEAGCDLITITQYLRPSVAPPPRVALGAPGGVRRAVGRGRAPRVPRVSCPGPWSARRTARGRLWGQAMRRYGRPIPEALAHLSEPTTSRQEAASLLAR